ncbi:hypothetical protein QX25_16580 [Stutzerimonas stutzeri]|uniref:Oxidase n=1 Tax=Stutzerimonas balearica DSM 6083 TaxID=1123016 RepID=A0A8D3Y361_9GAMM|nr:hypothetical protein [Stutzerimonas balearica]AJE16036.1 oxidase [Stutzerimonas balearica DSM 6083]KIL03575.1 hypothetical protein QX25_16580 [Stutzerimonas stutzeri]SDM10018.1 hypothetical protein SAMN05660875_102223 [Stutzerimonas balearica DSM 6083]
MSARLLSYLGLLALLGVSIALATSRLPYRDILIMLLAGAQALGVLLGFTRLQDESPLLRLCALTAWFFVFLLLLLTLLDLLTRAPV